MKRDLRLKDETIQQREIDISCLRGQVMAPKRIYEPENIVCDKFNSQINNDDDSEDSDTLTNVDALSEEDILLEDLDFDNIEIPRVENSSSIGNKDHNIV